jgi:hypothetical protein
LRTTGIILDGGHEKMQGFELPDLPDRSSAVFIQALRQISIDWHAQLPEDAQISIYVLLPGGNTIRLGYIAEQGYNGVYIQGQDDDGETFVLIAHQATLQFYCKVKKITPEQPRRPIGFGKHPPPPEPQA